MAAKTTVSARDGSVEISNRRWLLRVGVDGWLNPSYLFDLERNLPLADEAYAYALALAAKGDSGFTGGRELTSGPVGDMVTPTGCASAHGPPRICPRGARRCASPAGSISACLGRRTSRSSTPSACPTPSPGSRSRFGCATASAGMSTRSASSASVFARRSSTATANRGSMAQTARRSCPYRTGGAGGRSLIIKRPRIR